MGILKKNYFTLTICAIQLIATIERQTFDFLGFMWVPILINFLNMVFIIYGFFGAFQYRLKYIVLYTIWNFLWITWNLFLICFYLDVGVLDKNSDTLNFGTGSFSWWQVNGPGCKAVDITEPDFIRPNRPLNITGCVIDYEVVEVLHSSTQCVLAVIAILGGLCLIKYVQTHDPNSDIKIGPKIPQPLYRIEYSQPEISQEEGISPKPMTPRRVKRRSVISRDGVRRSSKNNFARHSKRRSLNSKIENGTDNPRRHSTAFSTQNLSMITQELQNYNRMSSNNWDRPMSMNWQNDSMVNAMTFEDSNNSNNMSDPVEYQNVQIPNPNDWRASKTNTFNWQGQVNPSFDPSCEDQLENGNNYRPASVRSTYSNYHGVRATPQVPVRTDMLRQSQRQFMMSGGPPAYQDTVI